MAELHSYFNAQALPSMEEATSFQSEAAHEAQQNSNDELPQSLESAASHNVGLVKRQAKEFQMLGEKATLRTGKAKRDPWNPLQSKIAGGVKGLAKWKSGSQ